MRPKFWISRNGKKHKISELKSDHFKNIVYFVFTNVEVYRRTQLSEYMPVLQEECFRRQLDLTKVLEDGPAPYLDAQGIKRMWEPESNEDFALN